MSQPHTPTRARAADASRVFHARHLLLITVDTLRADVLGAYGGPARTPNMDALAQQGWLFESAYSASMLTNPSHVSLMTGLYPRDHGVYDNASGVGRGVATLATALAGAGFRTHAVIGFPHLNPGTSNLGAGFASVVPGEGNGRPAMETSRLALGALARLRSAERLFMWVHYTDPHAPYEVHGDHVPVVWGSDAPMDHIRAVAPGFQLRNPWFASVFRTVARAQPLIQRYLAEVEATDRALGVLFAGLRQRGIWGQTAVVVTSDHGENLGDNDLFFHHGGLYAASTHVPLVIRVPQGGRRRVSTAVSGVDVAPTILALADLPPGPTARGRDLARIPDDDGDRFVFSEHMRREMVAVRDTHRTLIVHLVDSHQFPSYPFRKGTREYWCLGETGRLLRGKEDDIPIALLDAARAYIVQGLSVQPYRAVVDRAALRALGYIVD